VQNAVGLPAESEASRRRRREQLRAEQGVGDDEPVFLTIATNFELKGVAELIRALADWRRRHGGGRLWVLGRERPQRYARLAARLGVADAVQFFPATRDVFAWYAAADACVLLSWYDPCSRVVLEAMRMGLPTITTAYNGAADLLADGAGLVVSSPRDRAAVVEALDRAVDPLERSKMLAACHAAGSRIRVENHARALVDLYEGIVREKRARLRASALPQRTRPRLAAGGGLASRGSRAA
jgi:UDP-glucose:(heptosyl)LPS alpha-1,3-glucosyltransferase